MARRRNKAEEQKIVRARIGQLMETARTEASGPDADVADRCAGLALRIGRRYQRPLPATYKAQVCRACRTFRRAETARVRVHRGRLVTTCLRCGDVRRRPL